MGVQEKGITVTSLVNPPSKTYIVYAFIYCRF